jgi:hypothetical protein
MARPRAQHDRFLGPYWYPADKGWRVVLRRVGGRRRREKIFPTKDQALAAMNLPIHAFVEMTTGPRHGRKRRKSTVVYFVRAGDNGPIKIGQAANLKNRLADLQQAHWEKLVVLASSGSLREREVHAKFRHLRIRGEWFQPADELVSFIADTLSVSLRLQNEL